MDSGQHFLASACHSLWYWRNNTNHDHDANFYPSPRPWQEIDSMVHNYKCASVKSIVHPCIS